MHAAIIACGAEVHQVPCWACTSISASEICRSTGDGGVGGRRTYRGSSTHLRCLCLASLVSSASMVMSETVLAFAPAHQTRSAVMAAEQRRISDIKARLPAWFRSTAAGAVHTNGDRQTTRGARAAWWDGTHLLPTWRAVPCTFAAVLVRTLGAGRVWAWEQGRAQVRMARQLAATSDLGERNSCMVDTRPMQSGRDSGGRPGREAWGVELHSAMADPHTNVTGPPFHSCPVLASAQTRRNSLQPVLVPSGQQGAGSPESRS
jgi:hypothetical protein